MIELINRFLGGEANKNKTSEEGEITDSEARRLQIDQLLHQLRPVTRVIGRFALAAGMMLTPTVVEKVSSAANPNPAQQLNTEGFWGRTPLEDMMTGVGTRSGSLVHTSEALAESRAYEQEHHDQTSEVIEAEHRDLYNELLGLAGQLSRESKDLATNLRQYLDQAKLPEAVMDRIRDDLTYFEVAVQRFQLDSTFSDLYQLDPSKDSDMNMVGLYRSVQDMNNQLFSKMSPLFNDIEMIKDLDPANLSLVDALVDRLTSIEFIGSALGLAVAGEALGGRLRRKKEKNKQSGEAGGLDDLLNHKGNTSENAEEPQTFYQPDQQQNQGGR